MKFSDDDIPCPVWYFMLKHVVKYVFCLFIKISQQFFFAAFQRRTNLINLIEKEIKRNT